MKTKKTKQQVREDSKWFDVSRLIILSRKPVMDRPDFDLGPQAEGKQGGSSKPMPRGA